MGFRCNQDAGLVRPRGCHMSLCGFMPTCHVSKLMNTLLPFPLKLLSSCLCLQPIILAMTPLNASSSPPTASAVTNALNTTKHAFLDHCQDALQEVFTAPRIPQSAPP